MLEKVSLVQIYFDWHVDFVLHVTTLIKCKRLDKHINKKALKAFYLKHIHRQFILIETGSHIRLIFLSKVCVTTATEQQRKPSCR